MGAEKEIIVALEFGTSAIQGIAGRRKADGTVQILGIEQEHIIDAIQHGVIYNIDKTTQAIHNIIDRLNERLNIHIGRAYVGVGGQSLHTAGNVISRELETTVKVTPELIDNLKDNNRATLYPNSQILDVVPQEYIIGNRSITDPIGIQTDHIEAHFQNVVAKNILLENIHKCMKLAGIEIVDIFIAPLALADVMLTDNEKRSGCALVDFGAGTTTVTIYRGNLLRHLAVIPLGGQNINSDIIAVQQLDTDEAETLKRKYGVAYVSAESDKPQQLAISNDRTLSENDLLNIIGARQEEIILNAWNQIKQMSDKLLAGIIITGGAAQIKDMPEAIKHFTEFPKVKSAKSLITTADVNPEVITPQGNSIDTLIALLMHGNTDCQIEQEDNAEANENDIPSSNSEETSTGGTNETEEADEKNNTTETENKPIKEKPKQSKGILHRIRKWGDSITTIFTEEE